MTLRLLKDRVLVLLPPAQTTTRSGIHLAPALPEPVTAGRVVLTGPTVRDVAKGDYVTFPPTAGDALAYRGYACLLLRELEITTTMRKESVSA